MKNVRSMSGPWRSIWLVTLTAMLFAGAAWATLRAAERVTRERVQPATVVVRGESVVPAASVVAGAPVVPAASVVAGAPAVPAASVVAGAPVVPAASAVHQPPVVHPVPSAPEESATIKDDPTVAPDPAESADNNVSFPTDI